LICNAATISGVVLNSETGDFLENANIRIAGSNLGSSTDLDGVFKINALSGSTGVLHVSHVGYNTITEPFSLLSDTLEIIFHLDPAMLNTTELVYSSDFKEQTVRNASTKVDLISRSVLKRTPSQDLTRALETVPGISVKRSDGITTNSLSIRGSSNLLGGGAGNRVLLLIDGKPAISADTGGADWSSIPTAVIERVEVVKGSYSALYGSNAMGGIINLITRRNYPKHLTEVRSGFGIGELPQKSWRFRDTPITENNFSITHMNQLNNLGYYMSYSKRESNGYRQNSDYLMNSLQTRFRLSGLPDGDSFEFAAGISMVNRGFPHSWDSRAQPLHLNTRHPEWLNDRQIKKSLSTEFSWKRYADTWSLSSIAWANLALSESEYHDTDIGNTSSRADKFGARFSWNWIGLQYNDITMGLDFTRDKVNGQPDDVFYGKHIADNQAVFIQDQLNFGIMSLAGYELFDPQFTIGCRLDRHVVKDHSSEIQLAPKLGISLPGVGFLSPLAFRMSIGQAFRFPSIADLFLKSVPGNDYQFIANPDLRAESSTSFEFGINWLTANWLNFDLSLFKYQYRDMIHYRDTTEISVFEIVNLQRADINGLELSSNFRRNDIAGTIGYTFIDAKNLDIDKALPYQPQHHLSGSASWSPGKFVLSANLRYVSETEEVRFYPADSPGAYTLFGFKTAYKLSGVEVAAAVENIGAVNYEEMERYRMPGRIWRLDLVFNLGRK
jgi:outer membrane cobalamin receptor